MAEEASGNHIRSERKLFPEPVRLQVLTGTVQIGRSRSRPTVVPSSTFMRARTGAVGRRHNLDHLIIVIRWVEHATPSNARETK
jgi:hypothetical protein